MLHLYQFSPTGPGRGVIHWHMIIHPFKLLSWFVAWLCPQTLSQGMWGMSEGYQLQTQARSGELVSTLESPQIVLLTGKDIAKIVTQVFATV